MASQGNDPNKDFLLATQKKLIKTLKIKVKLEMLNQENDLDNYFLFDLERFSKASKKLLG